LFDNEIVGEPVVVRINDYDGLVSDLCPLSHVAVDYRPAIGQLIPHLEAAGYKRLGLVLHRTNEPFPQRPKESRCAALLRKVIGQSSLKCGPEQVVTAHEREPLQAWYDAATELLKRDPKIDILFVHTMDQVVPVIEAAKRQGRTIGKDLGLATFDDPAVSQWLEGGITVIREPVTRVASALAELGMAHLNGAAERSTARVEAELVPRASTRAA
jgi:LacI family transcriptional regulator